MIEVSAKKKKKKHVYLSCPCRAYSSFGPPKLVTQLLFWMMQLVTESQWKNCSDRAVQSNQNSKKYWWKLSNLNMQTGKFLSSLFMKDTAVKFCMRYQWKVVRIASKLFISYISYHCKLHSKAIRKDVKSNINKLGDARINAVCVTSV